MVARLQELLDRYRDPAADAQRFEEMTSLGFTLDQLADILVHCTEHAKYGLHKHLNVKSCDKTLVHCAWIAIGASTNTRTTRVRTLRTLAALQEQ